MLILRSIMVEGAEYPVLISDDSEALHAAYAAGGAIIGIWNEAKQERVGGQAGAEDFSSCLYLVTDPETVDAPMLARVVRRRMGMPWIIGETDRLLIREFRKDDPLEEPDLTQISGGDTGVFSDKGRRDAYIDNQYRFYECGLWALVDKKRGELVGRAGITDGELGYYIYPAFRRQGYAFEACVGILGYARDEMETEALILRTSKENEPSVQLANRLGFILLRQEAGSLCYGRGL